ncbi:hypothetical protein [Bosea thiooxidans]|uniref:hypothetical protein n=1 Tax=Bosea thiooxidans TaxID=53254 RepID=UPI0012E24103|nr:hypothetical protein [Bosea thiooxidans]
MAQILTACRIGAEWGFRDVTGEAYGHSTDIEKVVEAAHHMAGRVEGNRVALTDEAERHLQAVRVQSVLDSERRNSVNWLRSFRSLLARLRGRRDRR